MIYSLDKDIILNIVKDYRQNIIDCKKDLLIAKDKTVNTIIERDIPTHK